MTYNDGMKKRVCPDKRETWLKIDKLCQKLYDNYQYSYHSTNRCSPDQFIMVFEPCRLKIDISSRQ